jgi:lysozyme family protein
MSAADTDGVIGAQTVAAIRAIDQRVLMARFGGARLRFLTTISADEWATQGRGLVNRVANNLLAAA